MIRIGCAQINACVGDIKANAASIIALIKQARAQKVELLVFPELVLTGYPPEDLLLKPHFIDANLFALKQIQRVCRGITVLVGFVDRDKYGIYNACALIQDCKIKGVYHKVFLPNYGVFDEQRYFKSGDALLFALIGSTKFAVTICEDLWEPAYIKLLRVYQPDFIVNISASPFHLNKAFERTKIFSNVAKKTKADLFYCNLVGGQDELVFDGTSKVFSAQGKLIKQAKRFKPDLLVFDWCKNAAYPAQELKIDSSRETFEALSLGLKDYVEKNGFKHVIVGVSGGIDSAVVVALAALALGQNNVEALLMPSAYTSSATLADARKLCQNLGVKYDILKIDSVLAAYLKILRPFFKTGGGSLTEENLQARIRGALLMAFSNRTGCLVLNTGNKSEVSCGYCTLYGDMVGGFGVLKDVPKELVYKLADYINQVAGGLIPQSIIKRAPSAELKPNQKDSDVLPPYPLLDPILKLYVEQDLALNQIVKKGFKLKTVQKVLQMVDCNEYKRRQAPLGIKITPKAFGRDRRMPITNRFDSR